jgi:hypothetical protein
MWLMPMNSKPTPIGKYWTNFYPKKESDGKFLRKRGRRWQQVEQEDNDGLTIYIQEKAQQIDRL